jgi:membrane protein DedA with SNARE-associated domain/rhodanese-related sulfurtransferase
MNEILDMLARHGALFLFVIVFIDQMGLPVPAVPFLMAAGVLAGAGKLNLSVLLVLSTIGSLVADLIWFYLGRNYGTRILSFLCRISLEPDSCVRQTQDVFSRHGMKALVGGKFVPGLATIIPPLAGIVGISLPRFFAYDGLGSLLYTGVFLFIGFLFSHQLEPILMALGQMGHWALWLVVALLAAYICWKYLQRQRVLRELRIARISVDELRRMQEANEAVFVIDLRSELDLKENPTLIAGALHFNPKEMDTHHQEIPRDRDVVLYCSCPNEATAARTALLLRRRGITRVRPLAGGIDAWRERAYPLDPFLVSVASGNQA